MSNKYLGVKFDGGDKKDISNWSFMKRRIAPLCYVGYIVVCHLIYPVVSLI